MATLDQLLLGAQQGGGEEGQVRRQGGRTGVLGCVCVVGVVVVAVMYRSRLAGCAGETPSAARISFPSPHPFPCAQPPPYHTHPPTMQRIQRSS